MNTMPQNRSSLPGERSTPPVPAWLLAKTTPVGPEGTDNPPAETGTKPETLPSSDMTELSFMDTLKGRPIWVGFELTAEGKKVPLNANAYRRPASVSDNTTWGTFAQVQGFPLQAFVISIKASQWMVDFDHCFDETGQFTSDDARVLVNMLAPLTYGEYSQSRRGLHFYGCGRLPEHGAFTMYGKQKVEVYSAPDSRFCIYTGNCYGSTTTWAESDLREFLTLTGLLKSAQANRDQRGCPIRC